MTPIFIYYVYMNYISTVYMVFTTEGFLEADLEIWPELDLNPRPQNSVQML